MMRSLFRSWRGAAGAEKGARPFQLTRYFAATSLLAFAVLGLSLYLLERGERRFFEGVQHDQGAFFAATQAQLLRDQKEAGRANLLSVHEAGHVTLTHVFANALWDSHLAPLVARAQSVPVERCRIAATDAQAAPAQPACVAELRRQVSALPGFDAIDAPVRALMRGTNVFKMKVYDLRGLTVYSSEPSQVGEDKSDNRGWKEAAAGRSASELVHRNRFSAFEGEVENRDLIQSYIPVVAPSGATAAVLEIYSDVTPLLQALDVGGRHLAEAAVRNQERVDAVAQQNRAGMQSASTRLLAVALALLLVVYLALHYLVRNAQRIIDAEARAREEFGLREQEWHRDKMATMATMAANISHEVGNPLAIISGLAEEIGHWRTPADVQPEMPKMIVEQTSRIASMTRRISDFARAGNDAPEILDINQVVKSVCEFLRFDRRFRGTPIVLRAGAGVLACEAIPDHLNEVLMGLLQALEETCERCGRSAGSSIVVSTQAQEGQVLVLIGCECGHAALPCRVRPDDARLASARRRLAGTGGSVTLAAPGVELRLPAWSPPLQA